VADLLRKNHIRFEVDYSDKNMKEKIKACKTFRDPYTIVVGDKEAAENTVAINIRGNKQLKDVPLDTFVAMCRKMNKEHSLELIETVE
jgi:threonyl-tRNA synthetase